MTTAVVPFGSIEHQGGHLPVGAGALLADAVGREVASRLGALLLPTYRVGHAPAHRELPGTVSLDAGTLTEVAVGVGDSLARSGIRVIALVSTHGGNAAPLDAAVEQLNEMLETAVGCAPHGDLGPEPGTHSGEWITSVMLALAPRLVHREAAARELVTELSRASAERGPQHLDRFVRGLVDWVRAAGSGPGS